MNGKGFVVKVFDIETDVNIAVLNEAEAKELGLFMSDRVVVKKGKKESTIIIDLSSRAVKRGEVGVFLSAATALGLKDGERITLERTEAPHSLELVKKKMDGMVLQNAEMRTIVEELMDGKLNDIEVASFVAALYIRGMGIDETVSLTNAIVDFGKKLALNKHPVMDKHCTGGVAGNRTSMVLVPIIAAAGLYIPKTSSRSITSAAGTADTMEVLAPVEFKLDEIRGIVLKTNGCVVWGGGLELAPADEKLIRVRHPLRLDPKGLMLASILAKKKAVGSEDIVIDIPVGKGAKVEDVYSANMLARDFIEVGERLGMKIECLITDGNDPVGEGIGPALEAVDVLKVLQNSGPADLTDKSCQLAGALLEMGGKAEKGKGYAMAQDVIRSGRAYEKMKEIIEAQGGNPNVKVDDIPVGHCRETVKADRSGRIQHVDNRMIARIAMAAGAPKSKGAGIFLHVEKGDKVSAGQPLFDIIAESEARLDSALKLVETIEAVELQRIVLEKVGAGEKE